MEIIFSGFHQQLRRNGTPFIPKIYSGEGPLPDGFNAGSVRLDASEGSSLRWNVEEVNALPLVLWELDFSLTQEILEDEARYLSLVLAVDHFKNTIWPRFKSKTLGVVIYRGMFKEFFLDSLKLLASHLPDSVIPFVLFDVGHLSDLQTYFRLVNQVNLGYLIPVLKGKWAENFPYAFPLLGWDHPYSPLGSFSKNPLTQLPEIPLTNAVLLPEGGKDFPLPKSTWRVIPQQILTQEWEGIDRIFVNSSSIDDPTKRKLLGFCASGGEVWTIGKALGLPNEIIIKSLGDPAVLQLQETSQLSCPAF